MSKTFIWSWTLWTLDTSLNIFRCTCRSQLIRLVALVLPRRRLSARLPLSITAAIGMVLSTCEQTSVKEGDPLHVYLALRSETRIPQN